MMKTGHLVRGIIYDDTNLHNKNINDVVDYLEICVEQSESGFMEDLLQEAIKEDPTGLPTKDELFTTTILRNVIGYEDDKNENFIIPANMLEPELRNEMRKIDIGEDIIQNFMNRRLNKKLNETCDCENCPVVHMGITKQPEGRYIGSLAINTENDKVIGVDFSDAECEDDIDEFIITAINKSLGME